MEETHCAVKIASMICMTVMICGLMLFCYKMR
jgi:hypothetical protein